MVRVPVSPQVAAQAPQEPVAAPQFQAPPPPSMAPSMGLAEQVGRAGQVALSIQRDMNALQASRARQAERDARVAAEKAQKVQDDIDEAGASRALDLLDVGVNDIVSSYSNLSPAEAVAKRDAVFADLQKSWKDAFETLPEGMQRQLYGEKSQQYLVTARKSIDSLFNKAAAKGKAEADTAEMSRMTNLTVMSAGTEDFPVFVGSALQKIEQMNAGSPKDVVEAKQRSWMTSTTPAIVGRLIQNSDYKAANQFIKTGEESGMIAAAVADEQRASIEAAESDESSLATARNLYMSGATGSTEQFGDTAVPKDQKPGFRQPNELPDVAAIKDFIRGADRPEEWKQNAISEVDRLENARQLKEEQDYSASYNRLYDVAFMSRQARRTGRSQWQLARDSYPEDWARLRPKDRAGLMNMAQEDDIYRVAEFQVAMGALNPSDQAGREELAKQLREAVASQSITPLTEISLLKTLNSEPDFKKFQANDRMVRFMLERNNIKAEDDDELNTIYYNLMVALERAQVDRPFTRDEAEKFLDRELGVFYVTKGTFSDTVKPRAALVTPGEATIMRVKSPNGKTIDLNLQDFNAATIAAKQLLEQAGVFGVDPSPDSVMQQYQAIREGKFEKAAGLPPK